MGTHPLADPNLYFPQYGWVGRWFRPRKGTLGAMDLGGASTQITFETASPAEDPANEVQLRLYGQRYRVSMVMVRLRHIQVFQGILLSFKQYNLLGKFQFHWLC